MFEKYANKIECNGVERKQNEKRTVFAEKPRFARNRRILHETEQDLPGASQSPLHIPSSLAHSCRNAVRHVNIIHYARSITKRLETRQLHAIIIIIIIQKSLYTVAYSVTYQYLTIYRTDFQRAVC